MQEVAQRKLQREQAKIEKARQAEIERQRKEDEKASKQAAKQPFNDAKALKKQQKKNSLQSVSWDIDDSLIEAVDNIRVPNVVTT